ncbi:MULTISPECIES: hypothetical protein [unclassified Streptomyces]|uniref:hypothetical protein n=1 Tax=unclassified Streptomyces TaxID=2593676 RepID=UPI00381B9379
MRFTIAYTVRVEESGQRVAVKKPVCTRCQLDYPSPFQFESAAVPQEGGIWHQQHY